MDIVEGLALVKGGAKIRRKGWTKGMHVVQDAHKNLKGHVEPIFLFVTSSGNRTFLNLYSCDMNAKDWEVVS